MLNNSPDNDNKPKELMPANPNTHNANTCAAVLVIAATFTGFVIGSITSHSPEGGAVVGLLAGAGTGAVLLAGSGA